MIVLTIPNCICDRYQNLILKDVIFIYYDRNKTGVPIYVFTDADITERSDEVEIALRKSSVLFCSLIFDFIQMQWIRERLVI